jgi:type II secretory pathway pseudopilin PulG
MKFQMTNFKLRIHPLVAGGGCAKWRGSPPSPRPSPPGRGGVVSGLLVSSNDGIGHVTRRQTSGGLRLFPLLGERAGVGADVAVVSEIKNQKSKIGNFRAFTLIEVMVVVSLLSLIVLALMAVFSSTQRAFRSAVTQTDVLEGSRAAMELIASDLRAMTPGDGYSNALINTYYVNSGCGVNFCVTFNLYAQPLRQSLPGTTTVSRTNLLQNCFFLSQANFNGRNNWVGTGYAVNTLSASPLYPLYRFTTNAPATTDPATLFNTFMSAVVVNTFTNTGWSHMLDGVVSLVVRPYDAGGYHMIGASQYDGSQWVTNQNVYFSSFYDGEASCYFFSNTVPAAVEVEMGVLEDATLARAGSLGIAGSAPSAVPAEWSYLQGQAGAVHLFRQRVTVPNFDSAAYQ